MAADPGPSAIASFLTRPPVARVGCALLRRFAPVLGVGNRVFVFRHDDVKTVLERSDLFSVEPIYAEKMHRTTGDFILGMDEGAAYKKEATALRRAIRRDDVETMRALARREIASVMAPLLARGSLEVVGELTRRVPTRLLGAFFGTPGPDELTMMRWMRTIFWHLFLNLENDADVRERAEASAKDLKPYLEREVGDRRQLLAEGSALPDDLLSRLVSLGNLDADGVRRGIGGIIVGAVDTVSKASVLALDELLRRPSVLDEARALALSGDVEGVRQYAFEALRFNPHHMAMVRRAVKAGTLGGKPIAEGTDVYAVTLSATFDPDAVDRPDAFMPGRPMHAYLHFGHGMHQCYGRFFAAMLVGELVAAVLRLPRMKRAPGTAGDIVMEGPFPDRFVVHFDPVYGGAQS